MFYYCIFFKFKNNSLETIIKNKNTKSKREKNNYMKRQRNRMHRISNTSITVLHDPETFFFSFFLFRRLEGVEGGMYQGLRQVSWDRSGVYYDMYHYRDRSAHSIGLVSMYGFTCEKISIKYSKFKDKTN